MGRRPWLERTGCAGEEAEGVKTLSADRIFDGGVVLDPIALRVRKEAA